MQSNTPSNSVDVSDMAKREYEFRLYLAIIRMLRKKKRSSTLELYRRYIETGSLKDVSSKAGDIKS